MSRSGRWRGESRTCPSSTRSSRETTPRIHDVEAYRPPRKATRRREGLEDWGGQELFGEGTQKDVSRLVLDATGELEALGAVVGDARVGNLGYALAAYYIVAMAEASSNLSRYDGVRYGASVEKGNADWNEAFAATRTECFGVKVKRRIILGTFVLSAGYYEAYYLKAEKAKDLIRREFERAFKKFDVLLGPTMPVLPPKIGEKVTPLEDYMIDVNTVPANLAGFPAASLPVGFAEGLPVGMRSLRRTSRRRGSSRSPLRTRSEHEGPR